MGFLQLKAVKRHSFGNQTPARRSTGHSRDYSTSSPPGIAAAGFLVTVAGQSPSGRATSQAVRCARGLPSREFGGLARASAAARPRRSVRRVRKRRPWRRAPIRRSAAARWAGDGVLGFLWRLGAGCTVSTSRVRPAAANKSGSVWSGMVVVLSSSTPVASPCQGEAKERRRIIHRHRRPPRPRA